MLVTQPESVPSLLSSSHQRDPVHASLRRIQPVEHRDHVAPCDHGKVLHSRHRHKISSEVPAAPTFFFFQVRPCTSPSGSLEPSASLPRVSPSRCALVADLRSGFGLFGDSTAVWRGHRPLLVCFRRCGVRGSLARGKKKHETSFYTHTHTSLSGQKRPIQHAGQWVEKSPGACRPCAWRARGACRWAVGPPEPSHCRLLASALPAQVIRLGEEKLALSAHVSSWNRLCQVCLMAHQEEEDARTRGRTWSRR